MIKPNEFTEAVRDMLEHRPKLQGYFAITAYSWLRERLEEACDIIDELEKKLKDNE